MRRWGRRARAGAAQRVRTETDGERAAHDQSEAPPAAVPARIVEVAHLSAFAAASSCDIVEAGELFT